MRHALLASCALPRLQSAVADVGLVCILYPSHHHPASQPPSLPSSHPPRTACCCLAELKMLISFAIKYYNNILDVWPYTKKYINSIIHLENGTEIPTFTRNLLVIW